MSVQRLQVIDSHTGGEPTRVVVAGGPDLGTGPMAERAKVFREQFDRYRSAMVNEPRGSDVMVGALLLPPHEPDCLCGVIFFNNVGTLGMCGHGTMGLLATLAHMGRVKPGDHRIDTVVGVVTARLHEDGRVSVRNVASHRKAASVTVEVPGMGLVTGDVAWGGNWFFLVSNHGLKLDISEAGRLTEAASRIRSSVNAQGYPEVDHVELFGPPEDAANHSRNFVLCPGGAYDRSPCGTGTSAKLACLAADGRLRPGDVWRQESITGSVFEGGIEMVDGGVIPTVTGRAWITGESTLVLDAGDPFCWGIRSL